MKLSEERQAEFNNRMNDWISKQGLIFQLTHGGTGLGSRPPIIGSMIRAVTSLLLLSLVAALSYGGYLFWKATGDELPKQFKQGIAESLAVESVIASGFEREFSSGEYKQVQAVGEENSFFNHLDALKVSFQMAPFTGLFGDWDARTISINELSIALKAGEADEKRAQNSWQALFVKRPSFEFSKIEVASANLSWGYSTPATWGSVVNSRLHATRKPEGWALEFKGGQFSQGIFRDFTIEELVAEISQDGNLTITSGKLRKNGNPLTFSGNMTKGGARPTFEIEGQFTKLPVSAFLPRGLISMMDGAISGEFTADGSTNDANGICFRISARPEGSEGITLTKEVALLRMLSHLDPQRSYRKLPFNQGTFQLETKGSVLTFKDIDLSSQDEDSTKTVARLKGEFAARPATQEELENNSPLDDNSESTAATIGSTLTEAEKQQANLEFGNQILSRFKTLQFENPHRELLYVTKDAKEEDLKKNRVDLVTRRKFRVPFLVEGQVELAVPASAFEDSPLLPGVAQEKDEDHLKSITIELRDLVSESSRRLRDQWENNMEESQDDF